MLKGKPLRGFVFVKKRATCRSEKKEKKHQQVVADSDLVAVVCGEAEGAGEEVAVRIDYGDAEATQVEYPTTDAGDVRDDRNGNGIAAVEMTAVPNDEGRGVVSSSIGEVTSPRQTTVVATTTVVLVLAVEFPVVIGSSAWPKAAVP